MNEDFYKYRFMRLNEVFRALTFATLGKGYYNYGINAYACNEYSGEDIALKVSKRAWKRYVKEIRRLAVINDRNWNRYCVRRSYGDDT